MTKQIPLTQGKFALVDDEDYDYLMQWKWTLLGGKYAHRKIRIGKRIYNKSTTIIMHRLIAKTPDGYHTDHINGDTFDNRKENLRICKARENLRNQKTRSSIKSSKFKGVYYSKVSKKWVAQITNDFGMQYLGLHETQESAAKAYNLAAVKYFGEYARLNIIE